MQQRHLKTLLTRSFFSASLLLFSQLSHALSTTLLVDKLKSPWAVEVEPSSGDLLITEKSGTVQRFNFATGRLSKIGEIPNAIIHSQGGLMDVAVSPDYSQSDKLFFTYAKKANDGVATVLASAKLDTSHTQWQLTDLKELLVTRSNSDNGRHFGSRIAFDGDGHLFFSIGDRGERSNGQNLSTLAGSIIRLNLDGSIPADNPFVGRANVAPEIYSYGHRNPQGLVFIKESNRLLAVEHGPRGGDEINAVTAGANYGWPTISYGKEYWGPIAVGEGTAKAGMEQPLMQFTPSIAPSSMLFYQGQFYPELSNSLLLGSLALRHLNQVSFNQPITQLQSGKVLPHVSTKWLKGFKRRVRDLTELANGQLVIISDRGELVILER